MATVVTLLPLFFFLLSLPHIAAETCGVSACGGGPSIRFPFRLIDRQPPTCGYSSDFDLACENRTQTIITLPSSGDFIVEHINYTNQIMWINDWDNCIIKKFLDEKFSLLNSPFQYPVNLQRYTFYNCTAQLFPLWGYPISCLSNEKYDIVGIADSPTESPSPFCREITTAMVPVESDDFRSIDLQSGELKLTWNEPDCSFCEPSGKVCGLIKNGSQSEVLCSSTRSYGLTKGAKYGIAVGVLVPGLLSVACCALWLSAPTERGRLQESTTELSGAVTSRQPQIPVAGLDGVTIESYPKTQLGESLELPDPNDKTCTICLGEYQPKETMRTIPTCNHYFHANCIDEWLRKNPTCPLCRNLPAPSGNPPEEEVSAVRARDDYALYL